MFEHDRDIQENVDALPQDGVDGRLVDELLRRMAVARSAGSSRMIRDAVGVDEVCAGPGCCRRSAGRLVPTVARSAAPLRRWRWREPEIDVRITLDEHDPQTTIWPSKLAAVAPTGPYIRRSRRRRRRRGFRGIRGLEPWLSLIRRPCRVDGDLFCSDRYGSVVITTESRGGVTWSATKRPSAASGAPMVSSPEAGSWMRPRDRCRGGHRRLRGHQHRRGECQLWAAGQFHLLAFQDKDDLIAAVIERSFGNWLQVWQLPDDLVARERLMEVAARTAKAVADSPDFLRLGLMLALEAPARRTPGSGDVHPGPRFRPSTP